MLVHYRSLKGCVILNADGNLLNQLSFLRLTTADT